MSKILITKKSGDLVDFDINKLRNSLFRSGADEKSVECVILELSSYIQSGMSTHKVYKKAYNILSKLSHPSAGRYRLKKAIMDFGPTGYPFEKFIGAIIENLGYSVKVGQIVQGKCVKHEVDIVAENDKKIIVVECKFHRTGQRKSDVKVPLYIRSRFNDIYEKWKEENIVGNRKFEGWVVTNTRFTEDAENYGDCSKLKLISWDYPSSNSLRNMIDKSGLHPITSLKSISQKDKQSVIDLGVVLCKELTEEILYKVGLPKNKVNKVIIEAKGLVEFCK